MDSSGVTGPVVFRNKKGPVFVQVPAQDKVTSSDNESAKSSAGCNPGPSQEQRRMSVSGRTLLRKYFCEKDPKNCLEVTIQSLLQKIRCTLC